MTIYDSYRQSYVLKQAHKIKKLRERGLTMDNIARKLGISRMSVYRYLKLIEN